MCSKYIFKRLVNDTEKIWTIIDFIIFDVPCNKNGLITTKIDKLKIMQKKI